MIEYEFMLQDRIVKIQAIDKEYNLNQNAYISFSGGKDSVVLHHLIDIALPNNTIPRVFLNTGIEHTKIVNYVKELQQQDERIVIVNSGVNIMKMLNEKGFPFKSKEHSLRVDQFNKGTNSNYIIKYITGYDKNGNKSKFVCPQTLLYQFSKRGGYNYSNRCCYELKKKPSHKWAKENHRPITLTGMRADEGGNRKKLGCTIFNGNKLAKFHPLIVVSSKWENEFVERNNIKLCELYYSPYNFHRTGCVGCPFNLNLQDDLDTMAQLLPREKAKAEHIWKYVYDEYRRIGYRLRKKEQITIFDLMGEIENELC